MNAADRMRVEATVRAVADRAINSGADFEIALPEAAALESLLGLDIEDVQHQTVAA
jgi:hypothetical protein